LRAQLEEALAESDDLKRHLQDATDELEDLRDEVAGLRRDLADQADQSVNGSSVNGDKSRGVIRREVEKLEQVRKGFAHRCPSMETDIGAESLHRTTLRFDHNSPHN